MVRMEDLYNLFVCMVWIDTLCTTIEAQGNKARELGNGLLGHVRNHWTILAIEATLKDVLDIESRLSIY